VICFDDQGLAYVFLAAAFVPVNRRKRWLAAVAQSLETGQPMRPLARSTLPTRRWRARAAGGELLLRIKVDEDDLATTLVAFNLIDFNNADDRKVLAEGAARALLLLGELSRRNELLAARIRAQLVLRK
jgi:hypothetical protein